MGLTGSFVVATALASSGCGSTGKKSAGGAGGGGAGGKGGAGGVAGAGGAATTGGAGGSSAGGGGGTAGTTTGGSGGAGGNAGAAGSYAGGSSGAGGNAGAAGTTTGGSGGAGGNAGAAGSYTGGSGGVAGSEGGLDASTDVNPACQTISRDATRTVHLRISADNECEVFVNGASAGVTTSWGSPVTLDVSLFVHPGRENVIGVRGTNTSSQEGNDRGILGELDDLVDGGMTPVLVTDTDWKVSPTLVDGWTSLSFDDSTWIAATAIAKNGDAPWGRLLGNSTASWIWSAAVPASVNDKLNLETTYARRRFYFSFDGTTVVSTPGCP